MGYSTVASTHPNLQGLKRTSTRRYLAALAAGALGPVFLYVVVILLLGAVAPQHLPAPPISNQRHFDEKLRFLRDNPHFRPVMLGIGSSVVLRSIDFAQFQGSNRPPFRFLNLGIPGSSMKETRVNSRFFVSKFPSVRAVLTILVPPDFESCSNPMKPYDPEDAWAYVTGRVPSVWFYLKYISILDFVVDVTRVAEDRKMRQGRWPRLYHDRFGASPVERDQGNWNNYRPVSLDPACFAELSAWNHELQAAGITLYVVLFPMSPEWAARTPGARDYISSFERRVQSELHGTGVRVIEGRDFFDGPGSHVDAYHLHWSAARRFSQRLGAAITPELAIAWQ
jgi:hypothetical protein